MIKEGPPVVRTKTRLLKRLAEQGEVVSQDANIQVFIDGLRVSPNWISERRLAFALPAGGQEIALCSNVFIPGRTLAESADPRELGLCIGRLQIDGSDAELDSEAFDAPGWHEAEFANGRFSRRWTSGATPIPPGARIVIVDLAGVGYYWRRSDDRGGGADGSSSSLVGSQKEPPGGR